MMEKAAVCRGHRRKRTPELLRTDIRRFLLFFNGEFRLLENKFNTATTAKLTRQHRNVRPGPAESSSGANLDTFFRFPGGHLILSGRGNVRLFSLFQRALNPAGNQLLPPCFPPACALILPRYSPVLFTSTVDRHRPGLDAAERPTTSEVRTDSTGVLKTCFGFFSPFFPS